MSTLRVIPSLLLLMVLAAGAAAEPLSLSLQQAIDLALTDSHEARSLELDRLRAQENARAARGGFKTSADLLLDAPDFDERFTEVQIPDQPPVYNSTGTTLWRSRLSVTQPLPTNGTLSLSGELRQRNTSTYLDESDERERDSRFFTSLRLDFGQPLLVPNTLKLNLERAELELERANSAYHRTQLDVIYEVTSAYFGLLRAVRGLAIAQEALRQQEESAALAQRKFESGLIPEVEALQMEVDLAQSRSELLQAEGNRARAEDSFKLTVGIDLDEPVTTAPALELTTFVVDDELALEHALRHRAEIRESEIGQRLAQIAVEETDARRALRGDLRAFYELTGVSDPSLPYATDPWELFDSSWDDLRERPDNKGLTLSVTVPLWDSGVNAAEVAAAKATLLQRELDQRHSERSVRRQVQAAITRLRESRSRLEVLGRSQEVAERSYEISRARFDSGEITSQELALDRDRLTSARQAWLDAYISYQLATADLERQTLYDFSAGRSLVGG